MCSALEELFEEKFAERVEEKMQEGRREGEVIGKQQGINGTVKILQKLNLTTDQITEKIMEQFQLTEKQAESYFV